MYGKITRDFIAVKPLKLYALRDPKNLWARLSHRNCSIKGNQRPQCTSLIDNKCFKDNYTYIIYRGCGIF